MPRAASTRPVHPCRGSPTRICFPLSSLSRLFFPSHPLPPPPPPPPSPSLPPLFPTRAHSLCILPRACTRATRSFYGHIIRSALFANRRSPLIQTSTLLIGIIDSFNRNGGGTVSNYLPGRVCEQTDRISHREKIVYERTQCSTIYSMDHQRTLDVIFCIFLSFLR